MKFHKLPYFTRDVTGQHYRPLPSDVSLPRISERRRRLKFRLHTAVRELEDPGELEDLQMILSLADDVDEEFMEDVTLEEAEAFEVKEVTSFLQRLSSSCEERESSFACKTRTEGGENALNLLMAILGIVTDLRKNAKIPEK